MASSSACGLSGTADTSTDSEIEYTTDKDESHTSSGASQPPRKKCKSKLRQSYKQKYSNRWEKIPELRDWLRPGKDKYSASCKVCEKDLVAGLKDLKRHGQAAKHIQNAKAKRSTPTISTIFPGDDTKEDVKKAEIKIAAFIVEHNLSFQVMDHLSEVIKESFPDSKIAMEFSCKHTKTRSIVKNVIARKFRNQLQETLRQRKFSIIIDESTDISSTKQLAIVVRFFCDKDNKVKSKFLKLIEVSHGDATTLTTTILSVFHEMDIP